MTTTLQQAAQAVLDRWNSPAWSWAQSSHTGDLMHALRLAIVDAQPVQPTDMEADFDRLAREHGITGTAESRLCEVFYAAGQRWQAATEQGKRQPLTLRQISEATPHLAHIRSDYVIYVAQAIEAAHKITATPPQGNHE